MGALKSVVLPSAQLVAVDVIDGGDTLALHFAAAECGDAFVLMPVEIAADVAARLAAAATEAVRQRGAALQGRPLSRLGPDDGLPAGGGSALFARQGGNHGVGLAEP